MDVRIGQPASTAGDGDALADAAASSIRCPGDVAWTTGLAGFVGATTVPCNIGGPDHSMNDRRVAVRAERLAARTDLCLAPDLARGLDGLGRNRIGADQMGEIIEGMSRPRLSA